ARIISTTLKNQTGSAGATGSLGGQRATGPLLFINTGGQGVTISGGTLQGKSGVPIAFGTVTIPIGSVTVTGTAVNEGVRGDIATKVTVRGTATCSEEVFDRDGALKQADAALRMQAGNDPNLKDYVPVGNKVITGITKIMKLVGSTNLLVTVHANGVWVFDF